MQSFTHRTIACTFAALLAFSSTAAFADPYDHDRGDRDRGHDQGYHDERNDDHRDHHDNGHHGGPDHGPYRHEVIHRTVVEREAVRPVEEPYYYLHHHRYPYHHYDTYHHGVWVVPQAVVIPQATQVQVECQPEQPILATVIGGAAGALVGNQFGRGNGRVAATLGGTLVGALVGQRLGSLDATCANQAFEYAQTGTQVVWQNPDNQSVYTVEPTRTFNEGGQYCREYQAKVMVGNQLSDSYGTACRQPDGSWKIEN